MPFPTVTQSLPFLSGKREGRKQRSDINSVWHSKTGLGACRHLLLRYNESCVFFEELIRQAPLTFIRAWQRTTPAELLAVQRYTPPSRTWELEMFRQLTTLPSDVIIWLMRWLPPLRMGSSSRVHVIVGSGVPFTLHIRETASAGLTTFSLKAEMILGVPSALGYGIWSHITVLGMDFLTFFDYISNSVMMPILAIATCVLAGWFMNLKDIEDEITKNGEEFKRRSVFRVMIKYVAPVFLFIILVFYTLAQFGIISY